MQEPAEKVRGSHVNLNVCLMVMQPAEKWS